MMPSPPAMPPMMNSKECLQKVIIGLKSLIMYYHNCHFYSNGQTSMQDHQLFHHFYKKCDEHADRAVERFIGLYGNESIDFKLIGTSASAYINQMGPVMKDDDMFSKASGIEQEFLKLCEDLDKCPDASVGTRDMVGHFADHSENRLYKIKQRIKTPSIMGDLPPILGA